MTNGPTNYFLLIYDLATREIEIEEWGADAEGATAAYTEREHQYEGVETVEVVLVGADSLDTIHVTHSHYFVKATGDLIEQLARELLSS
ncbi:MAG: hypothetical protein WBC33_05195 [Conexibacter sp.]